GRSRGYPPPSQVAVAEGGRVVDVAESRPGRWADLKVFRRSGLLGKLARAKVGALGDLGYVGIGGLSRRLRGATPRRKPRGRERPAAGPPPNRAVAPPRRPRAPPTPPP